MFAVGIVVGMFIILISVEYQRHKRQLFTVEDLQRDAHANVCEDI